MKTLCLKKNLRRLFEGLKNNFMELLFEIYEVWNIKKTK